MTESQMFWPVECKHGEPDLFVCMACLNEVYQAKVPIQGCPGCGGVSTFEAFTLESIQDWGSPELIQKARDSSAANATSSPSRNSTESVEESFPT